MGRVGINNYLSRTLIVRKGEGAVAGRDVQLWKKDSFLSVRHEHA